MQPRGARRKRHGVAAAGGSRKGLLELVWYFDAFAYQPSATASVTQRNSFSVIHGPAIKIRADIGLSLQARVRFTQWYATWSPPGREDFAHAMHKAGPGTRGRSASRDSMELPAT
jgi:hypothetical protein